MLSLHQVQKIYGNGDQALPVVSVDTLTIPAGRQAVLAGPSGSGKTTLLHLLSGLLLPTTGEISFDGTVISSLPETGRDQWRANTVGYVFQSLNLLSSLSVLDNLLAAMSFSQAVPRPRQRQRALDLLEQVKLADKQDRYPGQLSMGEQQRVAVARAVVNAPLLLLADEPTASLDQANGKLVLEILQTFAARSGSILLVSTHDPGVMEQFSTVYQMRQLQEGGAPHAADHSLA